MARGYWYNKWIRELKCNVDLEAVNSRLNIAINSLNILRDNTWDKDLVDDIVKNLNQAKDLLAKRE